jgi:hypothetical protein
VNLPLADLAGLFKSLELESDAGKINMATIALILGGFAAKQIIEALGALVDRLIIVLWYRNREAPAGMEIKDWVDERSVMKEVRFVAVLAALCLAGLSIGLVTHEGHPMSTSVAPNAGR